MSKVVGGVWEQQWTCRFRDAFVGTTSSSNGNQKWVIKKYNAKAKDAMSELKKGPCIQEALKSTS